MNFPPALVYLAILLLLGFAVSKTRSLAPWRQTVKAFIEERTVPDRFIAPTGERDLDLWIVEGFTAYGAARHNLVAGTAAGALLPLGFAVFSFLYAWVNNSFAPAWARESFGPARVIELMGLYGGVIVRSTLIFAGLGALFATARRELIRRRLEFLRTRSSPIALLLDSRLFATVLGWALYALWALWPRGPGGVQDFSGALHHPWLWVFSGVIFSGYLHWGHATFLYRVYLWRWDEAAVAVVRRLLAGQLALDLACPVEADRATGSIVVRGFPRGGGAARLQDLIWRIPGVRRVVVEETGEEHADRGEWITLHVPSEAEGTPVGALIRLGDALYLLGVASGFIVYAAGLVYVTLSGLFYQAAGLVVVAAIQVELIGWAAGIALRALVCRHAQRRLPHELRRTLAFNGRELAGYRFGLTCKEFVVETDLSREEARRILTPVAARFGVERLFVRTAPPAAKPGISPSPGRDEARRA